MKGFSRNSPQKVHPNFAQNLGRQILGNTFSGLNKIQSRFFVTFSLLSNFLRFWALWDLLPLTTLDLPLDMIDDLNEFGNGNAAAIVEPDDVKHPFFCSEVLLWIFDLVYDVVLDADFKLLFSDPCEPSPSESDAVDCCNPWYALSLRNWAWEGQGVTTMKALTLSPKGWWTRGQSQRRPQPWSKRCWWRQGWWSTYWDGISGWCRQPRCLSLISRGRTRRLTLWTPISWC